MLTLGTLTPFLEPSSPPLITYAGLPADVANGNTILIDDGLIELRVEEVVDGTDIVCTVINGGELGSKKGVNVPNVSIKLPGITISYICWKTCISNHINSIITYNISCCKCELLTFLKCNLLVILKHTSSDFWSFCIKKCS